MIKIFAPGYSLRAHGWLGHIQYGRIGLVSIPYPVGLRGRYLNTSQYYSPLGWVYQIRRTWHGVINTAIRPPISAQPRTSYQQGVQFRYYEAIGVWQGFTPEQKSVYHKWTYPVRASGWNRFVHWFFRIKPYMPLYWSNLERAVGDSSKITDYAGTVDLTYVIDGGGSVISTGLKGFLEIPFACTLEAWTLAADVAGAIKIDIWKDTYANFPPTNDDSICGGHEPEIVATNQKAQNTNLSNWTSVSVAAGDILGFNVDSCATITKVTLSLKATRN
jgi:hypothetical protein